MSTKRVHVLVVDDDERLRALLRRYLTENGFAVTTAADAAEARARMRAIAFDLLVVDVMMPGENGLDFVRSTRESGGIPAMTPILMLTAMGESEDRIRGLEHGADDYLPKPFDPRELLLRMRSILRRAPPPPQESARVISFGPFRFDTERGELRRNEAMVRLTDAETALLSVLAANPGAVLSRGMLGEHTGIGASPRSVDVQVTRLRKKIEDDPKLPRYLHTMRGKGYMLRTD